MYTKYFIFSIFLCPLVFGGFTASAKTYESETNVGHQVESVAVEKATDPQANQPPSNKVPKNIIFPGDSNYYSKYSIVVDKKRRTLTLWESDNGSFKAFKSYPIDLGRKDGDKIQLGDLKTPEGVYFFNQKYKAKELDFNEYGVMAFVTNYPNLFDLRSKKTGSGIWLHSIPPSKSLMRGSRGCVVLRIDAIKEISSYIDLFQTPFIVTNEVQYVDSDEQKNMAGVLKKWVGKWKASWENKNIDSYIDFYSEKFYSQRKSKEKWKQYKSYLNNKYTMISVKISDPVIIRERDMYVIRFIQNYSSDTLSDIGEKYLYVKKENGNLKIIAERWQKIPKELVAQKQINFKSFN